MHAAMMHHRPWVHQQQMLVEQYPYYQYAMNEIQMYCSSSDHQEEENDHTGDEIPSETSGDQSPNTDIFRLAFAASQWSKLVLNAEGLFNKLMSTNALTPNEQHLLKNQIEQWLCMKQEYEECITGEDSGSLQGYTENTRRSLERIEEVTEADEKTDESTNWSKLQSRTKIFSGSESEAFDEEDQSDTESENSDLFDKLDECLKRFKVETDQIVDSKKSDCSRLTTISPVQKKINSHSFVPIIKPIPIKNRSFRRTSILPYSEMSNELAEFQKHNTNVNVSRKDSYHIHPLFHSNSVEQNDKAEKNINIVDEESGNSINKTTDANVDLENISIIKALQINNDEKQVKINKIQFDIDLVYKQVHELQNTIKVKEEFIQDMCQNCAVRNNATQKFKKKRSKLEEKYRNVEKVLDYKRMHKDAKDESLYCDEIDKYEKLLMHYEKKLEDTKIIKHVAGNSAKTLIYLKKSLSVSKSQMEKLTLRLKTEEELKKSLETEIMTNQNKIKEIESKFNSKEFKLKEVISENEFKKNQGKNKLKFNYKDESLIEENERLYRLDNLLKEKLEIERLENIDENETLRQEIQNLRHIRDRLIDMKCKYMSEGISTDVEKQRQLLLISEYVETIDAMIEQKNVMICGIPRLTENISNKLAEQMPIMNRLEKLSHAELVTLFYKYFYKVIDLKDSSKHLEIQNVTLEESLKKLELENERRIVLLQKSYERQISLLLNYYAEETSSSSYDNKLDKHHDFEGLIKENQALRRRLAHFDSLLKASTQTQSVQSHSIKNAKKVLKPELMQITLPPKTTKVTRQGNKLIFQTSEKNK